MIKNVKEIDDLKFGGKSYGLNKLNKLNVNVPPAYAIDQESINKILKREKLTIQELEKILNDFPNSKFAIRSSAANEDGNIKSFAGMYKTMLNVSNNIEDIISSIKEVNDSASSLRVKSYNDEKSKMNIVLQEMLIPDFSGVCFTDAINLDGSNSMYIEYVEGLGEKLVSGKNTAKSVVVSLEDYSYTCEDESDKEVFANLVKDLKKIRLKTNEHLDLEWCITNDKKVYFVQARPITKPIIIREKLKSGAIASPGVCSGNIYIIDEDEEDNIIEQKIRNFPKGAVLLAKTTDTNYVPAMKKASGIITTEGSVLSHAAIIAREFAIPCITGYKEAFDLFEDGKKIILDTNSKNIIYNNQKISIGNGKEINLLELYNFDNIIEENINDNLVLVEKVEDEFGIHIDEELSQDNIDKIEIFIRKKYKMSPKILADQKYLWYTEFKRYQNFPNYTEKCIEVLKICEKFDVEELKLFTNKIIEEMKMVYDSISTNYEKIYSDEYAQALHFLINLYMCNGCAMKSIYDYMKKNNIPSIQKILTSNTKESQFLKAIEDIRASIWETFVKNGWSSDNYYDYREEKISEVMNFDMNNSDVIDEFYKGINKKNLKVKKIKKGNQL